MGYSLQWPEIARHVIDAIRSLARESRPIMARTTQSGVPRMSTIAASPSLTLSVRDAARSLSISERTLYDWTRRGVVPHVRIGGRVLYRVAALDEVLRQRETVGAAK